MSTRDFRLLTFEDRILLRDELVEPGSLTWLLRELPALLFPAWLVAGWKGETRAGRAAWPAITLSALLL